MSSRRNWLLGGHALLMVLIVSLGIWWNHFALNLAEKILELENKLGFPYEVVLQRYFVIRKMLFSESVFFIFVLLCISALMVFLYLREFERQKSYQVFFEALTHDLKTPLASLRIQAEALEEKLMAQQLRDSSSFLAPLKYLKRLLDDSTQLQTQLESALIMAKIHHQDIFKHTRIYLPDFLTQVMDPWVNEAPSQRSWSLKNEVSESDLWIDADPEGLSLVLRIFLENSRKHLSPRDGVLPVFLSIKKDDQSSLGVVKLIYRDQGTLDSKIKNEDIHRWGYEVTSTLEGGQGLGLYLARILVERMLIPRKNKIGRFYFWIQKIKQRYLDHEDASFFKAFRHGTGSLAIELALRQWQ